MPPPVTRPLVVPLIALVLAVVSGCAATEPTPPAPDPATDPATAIADGVAAGLPRLRPVVLGTLPHATDAWTQGLEIADGVLYEGTGLVGRSRLRELDPSTGAELRHTPLPDRLYGEGITVAGTRIWQLTWRDGVALDWDRASSTVVRRLPWQGEGWGLCHTADGRLIASDGTDRLRVLSAADLAPLGTIEVRTHGQPVAKLNELECVPGAVWANVHQTDWLVRIDLAGGPNDGTVTAAVDAGGLLPEGQRGRASVLNGIAAIPDTDEFFVTGKFWPTLFRVRFAPFP